MSGALSGRLRQAIGVLLAAALVLFSLGPVAAQDDSTESLSEEIQILSSEIDDDGVAQLIVAIPPSIGEVSPDASMFAVLESGQSRAALVAERKDEVDVVLVIDTSGSMRGAPLAAAKAASQQFVAAMPEESRIAVIGFGASPSLASDLTTDRSDSAAAIQSLAARGETALWDAMVSAGDLLGEQSSSAPYVVVLSDGGDTASSASPADAVNALSTDTNPVGLYVVTLETSESDHTALESAASQLSGQVLRTSDAELLEELYVEIAGRLTSRYSVRFVPEGAGEVVLSVAVEDAIATVRTSLGGAEPAPAPTESVTDEAAGELANPVLEPELGAVQIADPGLLGGRNMLWIGAGAAFIGLCVLLGMVAVPAMQVQPIDSIRAADASGRASALNQRLSGAADRMIRTHDDSGALDRTLDAAGLDIRSGEFVVAFGVTLLCTGGVVSILFGAIASIVAIALCAAIGIALVTIRVTRRRNAFADQLQNTITIITGSLRAGRGLPQAIEMVALEAPAPTSEEFRRVVIETRVGRDPVASLDAVADRMESIDLEWIAQAIAVNRELGGDLIELLENLARTVRDRNRLQLQVRALSAEGRISGWVMMALPIFMYIYLRAVNPKYIALLHTTTQGRISALIGIVAMIGGAVWIRKLVNIRF